MISSLEDAMSFFKKWRDDRTRLQFIFSGKGVGFNFFGFLLKVSTEELTAVESEALNTVLTVSLRGARSFEFVDPREAGEKDRQLVEAAIEHVWDVTLHSGDRLGLYELRS